MRSPKRKQQLLIVDIYFFYTINKIVIEIFPLENDFIENIQKWPLPSIPI